MQYIYIASVLVVDLDNNIYKIQSADITKIEPHPMIKADHPDIFRNTYLVVRDLQKDNGY